MSDNLNIVPNPFIKSKNLKWEITQPSASPRREISPPKPGTRKRKAPPTFTSSKQVIPQPEPQADNLVSTTEEILSSPKISAASIEAGSTKISDHLHYFSTELAKHVHPTPSLPLLSIPDFQALYRRNLSPRGCHFVIHQHCHGIAGLHYDLRLQISETSSISFACMYGLPGDPNSKRLNRNATETRVHNLWNHLIETASYATGSLLIWDTGEYEVLPRRSKYAPKIDPDSASSEDSDGSSPSTTPLSEPERLALAFQNRKIKLRLHGTKLPRNYTLSLRLTKAENRHEQPKKPVRKRRRQQPPGTKSKKKQIEETPPSSTDEMSDHEEETDTVESKPPKATPNDEDPTGLEKELQEQEDEQVRLTNAYPGATNSINSIHQRKWYLSIDRTASGFYKSSSHPARWERKVGDDGVLGGFEPFFVLGREVERSVITGRSGDDILRDEGVEGFVHRGGWQPVVN